MVSILNSYSIYLFLKKYIYISIISIIIINYSSIIIINSIKNQFLNYFYFLLLFACLINICFIYNTLDIILISIFILSRIFSYYLLFLSYKIHVLQKWRWFLKFNLLFSNLLIKNLNKILINLNKIHSIYSIYSLFIYCIYILW